MNIYAHSASIQTVGSVMTSPVQTVDVSQTVAEARRMMERGRFRHLPVVEDGQLVGILSLRDFAGVAHAFSSEGVDRALYDDYLQRSVGEFVKVRYRNTDLVTVLPEDTLQTAAELIVLHRLSALPAVDKRGEPVGMVSYIDLLRAGLQGARLRIQL